MMQFDTKTAADYAGQKLDSLLERATRDTETALSTGDLPTAVAHFDELRETVRSLAEKMTALNKHIEMLSYETLPTMFTNQDVKTISIENVGRATVNIRWTASMPDKEMGLGWLKQTNNAGMIQETVHPQTLGAFAKEETVAGRPLPVEIFRVTAQPYISITKA
jgi:hypothetical protein